MSFIGVIDIGISNIRSVTNALTVIGVPYRRVTAKEDITSYSHLILPGDGAFRAGMERLNESGLSDNLRKAADSGKYILGICLGLQLLAESSTEFGACPGLGLVPGNVIRLAPSNPKYPVPQIGWNHVQFATHARLAQDLGESDIYYFMHSYVYSDPRADYVAATFDYGGDFVAMIENKNVFGVQFHPEKSQRAGLKLLTNYINLN